uniref:Peptidase S1 domain-containing protein n=1 Tax=Anopheles dirus TaxID=7168 RepID=A0A182NU14_9DIPT
CPCVSHVVGPPSVCDFGGRAKQTGFTLLYCKGYIDCSVARTGRRHVSQCVFNRAGERHRTRSEMAPSAALKLCLIITVAQFIAPACGSLLAASSLLREDITKTFLPNLRESIDDCHLRYYKYGMGPEPLPAFGRPAYLREFAHMAAVGWTRSNGTIDWNCGGSLIWENYVLSAAHCTADDLSVAPDVVRLGDINLYDSSDDQYAQQLKIVEIIRHPEHRFSSRYHDMALFRLEKNVTLHDTVAPGCLWNDEEIPFPRMEATGWGATGFGQASTPILLKVSLSVVKKAECDRQYSAGQRGLRNGLQDYQLCAGDIKMDTCPGDSGGPLQMKLLSNAKMTPFIIAVTSFGSVCGQSAPGVYMKVSPYIPWIRSELAKRGENVQEWSFKPYACALRYVHLREFEDDVVMSKSDGFESIDSSKSHMNILSSEQTVKINWPSGTNGPDHCYGVIVDEDTVVTLAHCAVFERKSASHIVYQDGMRNDVLKGHRHPRWRPGSYYNDIGILKMKNRFQFSPNFAPACIWSRYELPDPRFYVTGQGRRDLNEFNSVTKITEFKPEIIELAPRADIQHGTNCSVPDEYLPGLTSGVQQEHLCFGNKPFLVPESCQMRLGAPLRRRVYRMDRHFEHIYALNLFGRDCGFGRSGVATRLGSHEDWLKSILLPNYSDREEAVHFINPDLDDGDRCMTADGTAGLCAHVQRCPKIAHEAETNREVRFCRSGSFVCCPFENIRNATRPSAAVRELDDCESRYRAFHSMYAQYQPERVNEFYHMVYIGMEIAGRIEWNCPGTLITRNLVVSSAYCLSGQKQPPTVVNVAKGSPNATWLNPVVVRIQEVIIHPGYNATNLLHDIGLVRLKQDIVPTALKYPICLWQNETHTPFLLQRMVIRDGESEFASSFPMYNSDCKEYLAEQGSRRLYPSELCTNVAATNPQSLSGDPLVWYKHNTADNSSTQYLIGTISYGRSQVDLFVHARIAFYVPWIKTRSAVFESDKNRLFSCYDVLDGQLPIEFQTDKSSTHQNMRLAVFSFCVVLCTLLSAADGYKILFLVPFPGPSHWLMLKHFIRELTDRQHEVTCITSFPYGEQLAHYEEILIDPPYPLRETFPVESLFAASQSSDLDKLNMYWEMGISTSRHGLESPNVREFINNADREFDLIVAEQFFQESWLMFAHKFQAPIVTISTYGYSDFFDRIMGLQTPWSFVPHMILPYEDNMCYFEQLYNAFLSLWDSFWRSYSYLPQQDQLAGEAFVELNRTHGPLPSVADLERSISVILVNSHPIVSAPRPTIRGLVDIGGAHIRPQQALPDKLGRFMDEAPHGVIYFSLGAYMQSSVMPVHKRDAILRVFGTLPQRVIWKFEDDSLLEEVPPNVMITKWAPQNDILAHPATVLFISHGGQFGTFEAMHHGVPVLFMPFFGDQDRNADRAIRKGFASKLQFNMLTEHRFAEVVREMTENRAYYERAKQIGHLFTDRLVEPMEEAIYWIEYVARHKGAPHLKSKAIGLNWFEYHMLDTILYTLILLWLGYSYTMPKKRSHFYARRRQRYARNQRR